MNRYNVLKPCKYMEEWEKSYGVVTYDGGLYDIIDIVSHSGTAEDCKRGLVNHDGYDPNIICVYDSECIPCSWF